MSNKIIFSLCANKQTAATVAKILNAEIGDIFTDYFADGEVLVKTLSNVNQKDVIIIESTVEKVHQRLFELLLLIDSIKRGNPKSLTLFIPYFGYSRQERVSFDNEPISCEVVANILDTCKVDKILTFDIHHPDIANFFKTPFVSIHTAPLFGEYYNKYLEEHNIKHEDVLIVSPDHGSNERTDELLKEIKGCKKIIMSKHRPAPNFVEHLDVDGAEVKDKVCIILDDMIDTGGTILSAVNLLFEKGAKKVLVGATHAVFSHHSDRKLIKSKISDLVVTNTIEKDLAKGIKVLDIIPLININ